jgi:hypothetical protein
MFPIVTTSKSDMYRHLGKYMDIETANYFLEGYYNKSIIGQYCNGVIFTKILSPYIIGHELIHHITESIKLYINDNKLDIFSYLDDLINSLIQRNYYVFWETIKEIKGCYLRRS